MSTCRWNGSGNPRIIKDRHEDTCSSDGCAGCQPCTDAHCRVCGRTHSEGACPECIGSTRDDLRTIATMCDALPAEVAHRGINGEAMVLLGPATDPERWGFTEASVLSGRLPADWIEDATGELHPMFVLGTWEMVWRDHLEQPTGLKATLPRLVDYLDARMHSMATEPFVSFEDFARDLRRCRAHMELVLHDGEQVDRGAPCMGDECERVPLKREWGKLAAADGWRCPRCNVWRSDEDYRRNVAHLHRKEATHLSDRDMEIRTGVKAGTVRSWAREDKDGGPPKVSKRTNSGRTLYSVADVLKTATSRGLLSQQPKHAIDMVDNAG
jgi:uncharacterized C2H2 Zn-finger protein